MHHLGAKNDEQPSDRLGNSVTQRDINKFFKKPQKMTRSTMFMNTIIEERKSRLKDSLTPPVNPINKNKLDTTVHLDTSFMGNTEETEIFKLKKEYFKIVLLYCYYSYRLCLLRQLNHMLIGLCTIPRRCGIKLRIDLRLKSIKHISSMK